VPDKAKIMTENKKKARVIITSSRSLMALVAAHSLGKRGVEVIGADCVAPTMLSFSKYALANEKYHRHTDNPEAFLDDMDAIIDKYQPDDDRPYVLMPVFHENYLIIQHKERFEKKIRVATPDKSMLEKVHPKDNLALTAKNLDVNIPETALPESESEMEEALKNIGIPCLVKPRDSSGGRGIYKVETENELKQRFQEIKDDFGDPPLIQALVEGKEYCHTVVYDHGHSGASGAYRNLHSYPADFGSGALREAIDPELFDKETEPLLKHVGWNGVAEIDYLWDGNKDHKPWLIEVNPRFWAGMFHSVQSGVDYPWLNFHLFAYGKLPEEKSWQISGKKTKEPFTWLLAIVEESIDIAADFDDIKATGKNAIKELKDKGVKAAFEALKSGLKGGIQLKEAFSHYKESVNEAREVESQFSGGDDPFAALGGLYILAYWLKYKKLPPEAGGD
jgi:predicted ATP-grasp superfamily ATP-dependent carboligase